MDYMQSQIQESMDLLSKNLEKAKADPGAVINGQFRGVSETGSVTVWVDSLGRVERFRIEPGVATDGNEKFIMEEFLDANTKARRAAQILDFDGPQDQSPHNHSEPDHEEDYFDEEPHSFLESEY